MPPDLGSAMATTALVAVAPTPVCLVGSEANGLVTSTEGLKYPSFASIRMCVEAEENTMTEVANQNFAVSKWSPPDADILDSSGVMLFPAAAKFDILPGAISKLNVEELKLRLEAFGFTGTMVAKMLLERRRSSCCSGRSWRLPS